MSALNNLLLIVKAAFKGQPKGLFFRKKIYFCILAKWPTKTKNIHSEKLGRPFFQL